MLPVYIFALLVTAGLALAPETAEPETGPEDDGPAPEDGDDGGIGDDGGDEGSNPGTDPGTDDPEVETLDLSLRTDAETPQAITGFDPDTDVIRTIHLTVGDGETFDLSAIEREDGTGTDLVSNGLVLATVIGAAPVDFDAAEIVIHTEGGTFNDNDDGHRFAFNTVADTIFGNGGDDTLTGTNGDILYGGDGNDVIFGAGPFAEGLDGSMNTLDGGAGDDIILSSNGNVITGGDGADTIGLSLTQYNGAGTGAGFDLVESIITDFDPAEDIIVIESGFVTQEGGASDAPETVLSIEPWADGTGADILAAGQVIARVTGGQNLTVADLQISENGLEGDLLGWH